MDAVIEKWEEILQTVKSEYEVTDVPFNTWLKPLKVYEVDGSLITVAVPSEQAAIGVNYISKRYKIPLQVTICVLTGMEECEVRFVLKKDLLEKEEEKKERELLRKEYLASVRMNLRSQLDNIDVKEKDGSIVNLGEKYGIKKRH